MLKIDIDKLQPKTAQLGLVMEFARKKRAYTCQRRNCPACGSLRHDVFLATGVFTIVECRSCRMRYMAPLLTVRQTSADEPEERFVINYKKIYRPSEKYRQKVLYLPRLQMLRHYVRRKTIRLLDLGCGTGGFLETARASGMNVFGVETSPWAFRHLQDKFPPECLANRDIRYLRFAHPFDVIHCWAVLEHVPEPRRLLHRLRRLLAPRGVVYAMVPNIDSLEFLNNRERSTFVHDEHYNYWNPATFRALFERCGFEVLDIRTEGLDVYHLLRYGKITDPSIRKNPHAAQDLINKLGVADGIKLIARRRS